MPKRNRAKEYREARKILVEEMGNICTFCGDARKRRRCKTTGNLVTNLEFHHKFSKGWHAETKSRWVRLATYRREWKAGLVVLACGHCNKKLGPPLPSEQELKEAEEWRNS